MLADMKTFFKTMHYLNMQQIFSSEILLYRSNYDIDILGGITSDSDEQEWRIAAGKLQSRKIAPARWRHPTARRNVKSYVKSYVKSTFNMH